MSGKDDEDKPKAARPFADVLKDRVRPVAQGAVHKGDLTVANKPAEKTDTAPSANFSDRLRMAKAATAAKISSGSTATLRPGLRGASDAAMKEISENFAVLGFLLDATASRHNCWGQARNMTYAMFDEVDTMDIATVKLMVRFMTMSNYKVNDHGAHLSSAALKLTLSQVTCANGDTRYVKGLEAFLETPALRPKIIVVIGDSSEERYEDIVRVSYRLKEAGIRVFAFLDTMPVGNASRNMEAGRAALRAMAHITGGRFEMFDDFARLGDFMRATLHTFFFGDAAWQKVLDAGKQRMLTQRDMISGLLENKNGFKI